MLFLLLIIIVIVFITSYRNLSKEAELLRIENLNLRKKVNFLIEELEKLRSVNGASAKINAPPSNAQNVEPKNTGVVSSNINDWNTTLAQNNNSSNVRREPLNVQDTKNIVILIVGAICIVLSAIVFLFSSWNVISDIFKSLILILVMVVFFLFSYIAKEKFNLDKTSDTFFYIAMAYIPIWVLSISFFGLVGEYLSITGAGRYIYLFASFALISGGYYFSYKVKNNNYMLGGSILAQLLTIVFFSLIFEESFLAICINILLYNIALIFLTRKELFKNIYNIIPVLVVIVSIFYFIISAFSYSDAKSMEYLVMLFLLAINFGCLEAKESNLFYSLFFNIFLLYAGVYLGHNYVTDIDYSYLTIVSFSIIAYICEFLLIKKIKRQNLKTSFDVIFPTFMVLLHINLMQVSTLVYPEFIALLLLVMLFNSYLSYQENEPRKIISFLLPMCFIVIGVDFLVRLGLYNDYCGVFLGVITFVVGEVLWRKNIDETLGKGAFYISQIYLFVFYSSLDFSCNLLSTLMITGVCFYSYYKTHYCIYKYLSYLTIERVVSGFLGLVKTDTDIVCYSYTIAFAFVLGIESILPKLKDRFSDIFASVLYFLAVVSLYEAVSNFSSYCYYTELDCIPDMSMKLIYYIPIIIMSGLYVFYNFYFKKSDYYNVLPLLLTIPALFMTDYIYGIFSFVIMIGATVGVLGLSLLKKKVSVYTYLSFIYLILLLAKIDNEYLKYLMLLLYSLVQCFTLDNEKGKDFFKFNTYLSCLLIYNKFISDIELKYTIFVMLGYVVTMILTSRTILADKYIKKIDTFEYVVFGLLYLISILLYDGEVDGMLFGGLIIGVIVVSYLKKYNSLFNVSVIAMLFNIFLLTREFWFGVPWWAYLLGIGSILLVFAIRNEAHKKKNGNEE